MLPDKQAASLLKRARAARAHAYSRHRPKRIKVGAAVLTEKGKVFGGCNISNQSSTLGMCAERIAMWSAVAAGHTKFKAIAIAGNGREAWTPCGACRQVMSEFDPKGAIEVIMTDGTGRRVLRARLKDLFPLPFRVES
jgi:homotetrameric cytidine deaminase